MSPATLGVMRTKALTKAGSLFAASKEKLTGLEIEIGGTRQTRRRVVPCAARALDHMCARALKK